jgi:hypothetical protein
MQFVRLFAVVSFTAFATMFTSIFVDIDWMKSPSAKEVPLSYNEVAAISMGAAALSLGAVALIVTLFAAIGVSQIKKEAVRLARRSADDEIQKRLDNLLVKRLDQAIKAKLPHRIDLAIAAELPGRIERALFDGQAVSDEDVLDDERSDLD